MAKKEDIIIAVDPDIESDGPKADIADVVIRHINTHTHIRSVEEEPAFKELCEKLDLEKVEPDGDNPF